VKPTQIPCKNQINPKHFPIAPAQLYKIKEENKIQKKKQNTKETTQLEQEPNKNNGIHPTGLNHKSKLAA